MPGGPCCCCIPGGPCCIARQTSAHRSGPKTNTNKPASQAACPAAAASRGPSPAVGPFLRIIDALPSVRDGVYTCGAGALRRLHCAASPGGGMPRPGGPCIPGGGGIPRPIIPALQRKVTCEARFDKVAARGAWGSLHSRRRSAWSTRRHSRRRWHPAAHARRRSHA